jgi:hypothetical protein
MEGGGRWEGQNIQQLKKVQRLEEEYSPNYDYKLDYWNSKSSVDIACFLPGRAKSLSAVEVASCHLSGDKNLQVAHTF